MTPRSKFICWIEAMRLRTLPVSLAGVTLGIAYALREGSFQWVPAILCFIFALLAQIASNFANEYFDYVDGLDRPGREGPRRGVTEGDITPRAMLIATVLTLILACGVGLAVVQFTGIWLIPLGIFIALGVIAYSSGPWPLSRHGLGEVAVIIFYGIIPVCAIVRILCGHLDISAFIGSISIGLLGANVLIINNYRDTEDDRSVGKHTLSVIIGASFMPILYALNSLIACALMWKQWASIGYFWIPIIFVTLFIIIAFTMRRLTGRRLTPLLGITALLMLIYSVLYLIL